MKALNCALLLGLFAVVGGAQAASSDTKLHFNRAAAAQAEKASAPKVVHRPASAKATVTYSGTTVDGPVWDRPFATCDGLSSSGAGSNYSVQPFTVDTAGDYSVHSEQSYDGFIFVYEGSFDDTDPLTNCVIGNDDDGTNVSTIDAVTLSPGTTYFVVTTAFSGGDTGTFDNTIDGPGNISLADLPQITLAKTSSDVVVNGNFTYTLTVQNTGETDETITVTDPLPAGLTYVSNTCGGTFASGTFTWSLGSVTSGTPAASCTITVNNPASTCAAFTNTATATTVSGLTKIASVTNANLAPDGGLEESGPGGAPWDSTSTNFGTVLCDSNCSQSPDNVSFEGDWWAWFAGLDPADTDPEFPEVGTLSQSFVIPDSAGNLSFQFRAGTCGGVAADFIKLSIDGTEVWRVDGTNALCGAAGYSLQTVDISAYADGQSHDVEFYSEQTNTGSTGTNFFVDAIGLDGGVCTGGGDHIFSDGFDPPTP